MSNLHNLDASNLLMARIAILTRFRILGTRPNFIANIHMFTQERVDYSGGFFQAALHRLIEDECIDFLHGGRFLRLLEPGYQEARAD